jgi:hypothetical protein
MVTAGERPRIGSLADSWAESAATTGAGIV